MGVSVALGVAVGAAGMGVSVGRGVIAAAGATQSTWLMETAASMQPGAGVAVEKSNPWASCVAVARGVAVATGGIGVSVGRGVSVGAGVGTQVAATPGFG
jgi:F0F1-type ATP synthase membrane subunit c/vacuolar-type H+-ATPase subunit K